MFTNVFWTHQHIPPCASTNRATSSMGGSSWCRSPHKPSHTSRTKQHNRSYSCSDHMNMNMRHQGFYSCAVNIYCRIAPSPSSAKAIGKWSFPTPGGAVCAHTVVLLVCVTHE